ncbi:MAG: PIN domain-containing protein [Acidiferrobacteraceae bacterium]
MSEGRIIADTNIISYLMKGSALGQRYKPHLAGKVVGIVFVTVAEMHYGAEKNNWGEKRQRKLEEHLKNFVVLPYHNEIAKAYARVVVERERVGRPISWPDAWIAATAIWHRTPLVTHDGDFGGIPGLQLITEH